MDEVCRFCTLSCTTLENIFDERERTDNEPLLISILQYCTNCEVSECDSLPQNICGPCKSAAKYAFEFKLGWEQSNKYFMERLSESEQFKIKYEVDEICRFCTLNCTTIESIFAERERTDNEPLLIVMLECLTNCEIREFDPLPQNICGPCKSAAKNAFAFKLRCEQSEKYFKDLLIACDQKPDIDELITGDSCSSENTFVKEGIKPEPGSSVNDDSFEEANITVEEDSITGKSNETADANEGQIVEEPMQQHSDERLFKSECSTTFKAKGGLKKHTMIPSYDRRFECDQCNNAFATNDSLKRHMTIHSDERPYKCDVCPKAFKTTIHLNNHFKVHFDERPFKCDHCSKAFKTLTNLKQHEKIHYNDRSYECEFCPKAFNRKYCLSKHMKTHSKNGPYKCEQCSVAFKDDTSLKEHNKKHSDNLPYKCVECPKGFQTDISLYSHKLTHYQERR